jgi:AcrR family transcriptional regulator
MPVNDMAERPKQRSKPAPKAGRGTDTDTSRPQAAGATALKGRAQKAAERREAILAAALDEFAARGFAATRIDDVAERAGVAKGTIYLHFADKEALFQEIVRTMVVPLVMTVAAPPADVPVRRVVEGLMTMFIREVYGTKRREIIRLMLTEGPRFPALAEFYYREVVERAVNAMRALLTRAYERGDLKNDALVRFPHLIVSPLMLSIVWSGLFDRFSPLDVTALMRAHLDLIFGKEQAS